MLILLCFNTYAYTDDNYIRFRHIDSNDGLSHNGVMALYQDRRGFIWMGTQDGLNVYNGEEIRIYKYDKYDPDGILDNSIVGITGDGENTVFIQSDMGIVSFDIPTGKFRTVTKGHTLAINYQNNLLYYSINNQIIRYSPDTGRDTVIFTLPDIPAGITALCGIRDSLVIGTEKGLYFTNGDRFSEVIPDIFVRSIYKDSYGILWICSYDGKGLFSIDKGKITEYRHAGSEPNSLSHDQTHVCCEDAENNIWIGTFDGLNRWDRKTGKFTSYYHSSSDDALTESSIWSLLRDRQGNIWAGTYYGGVNCFSPTKADFRKYTDGADEDRYLSASVIGQITEDRQNNLWICTEGGGLCRYDMTVRRFTWFKHESGKNSISHNHVKCVWYDPVRHCIWAGTHLGGLNRFDMNTGRFTTYRETARDASSDIIMSIVPYGNNLILGTFHGAFIFNPETGGMSRFMKLPENVKEPRYIYYMLMDSVKNLWIICSAGGLLCRYNMVSGEYREYPDITMTPDGNKNMEITSIYEDSGRNIWVCTAGNGIEVFNNDRHENLDSRNNGLGSDVVYAVRELGPERYILTTDAGISILNYSSRTFTNYDRNKDIPLSSISENSLYITSDGEIFVGGMDGMVSFREEMLTSRGNTGFSIWPYTLTVNSEPVFPEADGILSRDISMTEAFDLKYRQNSFSLKYTATDYLRDGKYSLEYSLQGYSDEWFPMDRDNSITYSKLRPGKYRLTVRAVDISGHILQQHTLGIRVHHPFYTSAWACIIYILCAGTIAFLLARSYNNRLRMQAQLDYEKRHAEDMEKMNQEKLQFFTDISHEFRTPVSVISGQIRILMDKYLINNPLHAALSRINESCVQLQDLIDELLEFRKLDRGYLSIKAAQADIVGYVHSFYLQYGKIAQDRGIRIVFNKSHNRIMAWFDPKQMYKVVNNLLSNAFKYVDEKGTITISVRKGNGEVVIEVTNTGSYIGPDDMPRIFDRFYQAGNARKGTGIGLHLAKGIVEKHHGTIEAYSSLTDMETTFSVHLPLNKDVFSEDETAPAGKAGFSVEDGETLQETASYNYEPEKVTKPEDDRYTEPDVENEPSDVSDKTDESGKQFDVLIIEDDRKLRDMLVELFSEFYNVISASDGSKGYEIAMSTKPDMIVSDVFMPGMTGIELCGNLKGNPETSDIPIILLSAVVEKEQMLAALSAGADDYIRKPFDIDMLIARCNNILRRHGSHPRHKTIQQQKALLASNIREQDFLDKARKAVMDNIEDETFDARSFAAAMGMSRTVLFNRLKAVTGYTPKEFIIDTKMEMAAAMLEQDRDLNIAEIADRLGFATLRYFRKCFKNKFGVSPSSYRGRESELQDERLTSPEEGAQESGNE